MPDPVYKLEEMPAYDEAIRALQDIDPARATTVFNPVLTKMLNNTHKVKKDLDAFKGVCYTKAEVDSSLSNKADSDLGYIPSDADLLQWASQQTRDCSFCANSTNGNMPRQWYFCGHLYIGADGYRILTLISDQLGETWKNVNTWNDINWTWTGWTRMATATPPKMYTLPLVSGFTEAFGSCEYYKDQFGIVTVSVNISTVDHKNTMKDDVLIGNLPVGYRTSGYQNAGAIARMYEGYTQGFPAVISINPGGDVHIGIFSGMAGVAHGQISFPSA